MDGGFLRMQWGSFRGETYRWLLKNTPGYFGWLINKLKQDKLSPSDHLFLFKMTLIKYASMFPEGNEIVAIKEKKKKTTDSSSKKQQMTTVVGAELGFRSNDNMLALKFKNKHDVSMLTTIQDANMSVWKRKHGTDIHVQKPTCIIDYCRYMEGVDHLDQFGQYSTIARKTKKWWRKLFYHIMNICIVNSYRLYEKYTTNRSKKNHEGFHKSVVETLIIEGSGPRGQTEKTYSWEKPARLTARHFPAFIPAKQGAKHAKPCQDCVACNVKPENREGSKRKQIAYLCPD
ncbi:piggyBac transposable element-derived protein 4-like [Mya arenaria]|uniref:piggyBac transposable element-derived protein 4-like n=1 Tax=Mya arenaria TaxID=6604 RepID=UPI0022E0E210|nr:piggyBac transposable element-derived protein 4-like [Mya arenaria]